MMVEHDRSSLAEALLELSDGDEPVVGKGEKASHACTPTTVSLVILRRHVRAFCGTMHNIDSTGPPQYCQNGRAAIFCCLQEVPEQKTTTFTPSRGTQLSVFSLKQSKWCNTTAPTDTRR